MTSSYEENSWLINTDDVTKLQSIISGSPNWKTDRVQEKPKHWHKKWKQDAALMKYDDVLGVFRMLASDKIVVPFDQWETVIGNCIANFRSGTTCFTNSK